MRSACVSVRLCVCVCVCVCVLNTVKRKVSDKRARSNKQKMWRPERARQIGSVWRYSTPARFFCRRRKKMEEEEEEKAKKKRASSCTQRQPPPSFLSFLSFLFFLSLSFLSFLSFFGRSGVLFWRLNALSICCVSCVYEERRKKHTHTLRET